MQVSLFDENLFLHFLVLELEFAVLLACGRTLDIEWCLEVHGNTGL